jgi:hypothetical protein
MANTFTLIASSAPVSSFINFNFTSIPSTYDDLCLLTDVRLASANDNAFHLEINGRLAGYYVRYVRGDGAGSLASGGASNAGTDNLPVPEGASQPANTFATTTIYFPNYKNTSLNRCWVYDSFSNSNSAPTTIDHSTSANDTTLAITSIKLRYTDSTADFAAGSTAYLYGINKS